MGNTNAQMLRVRSDRTQAHDVRSSCLEKHLNLGLIPDAGSGTFVARGAISRTSGESRETDSLL
jgi:hypothetical protein